MRYLVGLGLILGFFTSCSESQQMNLQLQKIDVYNGMIEGTFSASSTYNVGFAGKCPELIMKDNDGKETRVNINCSPPNISLAPHSEALFSFSAMNSLPPGSYKTSLYHDKAAKPSNILVLSIFQ